MSNAVIDFLDQFQALSLPEQHEVLEALLRHVAHTTSPALTDDQLTALADDCLASLDAEEQVT